MAHINQLFAVAILFGAIQLTFSECIKDPEAFGMENNMILDAQITASSEYDIMTKASNARLNLAPTQGTYATWAPKFNDANQWLQIDLKDKAMVLKISTQGRPNVYQWDQWMTTYIISYRNDGYSFQDYKENGITKIFQGNIDRATIVSQLFSPPIDARYIRVNPQTWHNHIAIRMELFGCFHYKTPVIAYPVANHALSQKVLLTATEVQESYKCLMMCQLEPSCKSFNFSKKFKVCELNTATKDEFPGNYGVRENYEYYHFGRGITMAVEREL